MAHITQTHVIVRLAGEPQQAVLLFFDNELLALVVRLEPELYANDPDLAGKWSVEASYGACAVGNRTMLFDRAEDAVTWAGERAGF